MRARIHINLLFIHTFLFFFGWCESVYFVHSEVAAIKNVIAKQLGSNNLLNNARAAVCALDNLTTKSQVFKKRDINSN